MDQKKYCTKIDFYHKGMPGLQVLEYENNPLELINKMKDYILKEDCKDLYIDISCLNIFDATRVCALISVYHLAKYVEGKITWQVKDKETYKTAKMLKLKNCGYEIVKSSTIDILHKAVS